MRAKNSKAVTRGYVIFAVGLCFSILTGVGCIWSFVRTAENEVEQIEQKTKEYDLVHGQQLMLTGSIDSLYNNITLLNSDRRLNQLVLQTRISTQKMNLLGSLEQMNSGDVQLYSKLAEEINSVLQVKDSVQLLTRQVDTEKEALNRCIQDNRSATRQMIFSR